MTTEAEAKIKREISELLGQRIPKTPLVINEYLSGGAFGQIFMGINEKNGNRVAIKSEPKDVERAQLFLEYGFYLKLSRCPYLPKIFYFGLCGNFNVLVMELFGPSLLAIFKRLGQPFSLRCTAAIGVKLMEIMHSVHDLNIIYRDVKPENFLLGLPNTETAFEVFLIDLGLCKQYRDDNQHISFQQGKCITGTLHYMSANMHFGYELSRRDDLEAVMYMLIYLNRGQLPWSDLNHKSEPNLRNLVSKIGELKRQTAVNRLCESMGEHFENIMNKIKELKFEERPAYYDYIFQLLSVLDKSGIIRDFEMAFDWDEAHRPKFQNSVSTRKTESANRLSIKPAINRPVSSVSNLSLKSNKNRPSFSSSRTKLPKTSISPHHHSHRHLIRNIQVSKKKLLKSQMDLLDNNNFNS